MRFAPSLAFVTGAIALSGCVAVPIAQLAVSRLAPATPPCVGCDPNATLGMFDQVSKGMTASFHKLTDSQTAAAVVPAK